MYSLALFEQRQLWLAGLAMLWALLLFGGFLLGVPNAARTRRMPTWTRMLSSLTLVVAAWSWYGFTRTGAAGSYALLIAIGMTFGFCGDVFMARLLPVPQHVLWGMGAFGLGHIAYIAAFLRLGDQLGLNAAGPRWGAWIVWLLIGLAGWYFAVYRGQHATVLHKAALPYALLLANTAGLATGLAVQNPAFAPLALGAGLFLASDLILAAHLFSGICFRLIDDVVWLAYGPAQALIVYSVGAAMGVLGQSFG